MDKKPKAAPRRDPLAPPDWWKKWRPLRWLSGGAIVLMLALWARNLIEWNRDPEPARPQPAAAAPAAEPAPAPVSALPPTATPAPPAAQAVPAAAVVPAAAPVVVTELPEPEVIPEHQLYTRVESAREPLLGDFRSYAAVDEVMKGLEAAGYAPILHSSHRKLPSSLPPFNLDRIEVAEYKHLGQAGKLSMQFFNDRLFETEFEPADAKTYVRELRRALPQLRSGKTGRAEWIVGSLRVASSLDLAISDVGKSLRTRPYVLWQDRRLVQQRDSWDLRYAAEMVR